MPTTKKKMAECEPIPQIVQGEYKELTAVVLNENGEARNLDGVTLYQSVHPTEDGEFLVKKSTDATYPIERITGTNKIKVPLSPDQTKLLKPCKGVTMFLVVDFPSPRYRSIFEIEDAYDVIEAEFTLT